MINIALKSVGLLLCRCMIANKPLVDIIMSDSDNRSKHHTACSLCCRRSLDNTIGELNVRNRVGGGLHDEFPARDTRSYAGNSPDFIDYVHEPLNQPPFVSGNESSSELDDQASSLVSSAELIGHIFID